MSLALLTSKQTEAYDALASLRGSYSVEACDKFYSFLKHISIEYMKFKKYYEEHRIGSSNDLPPDQLAKSLHELKELVLEIKANTDKEIKRAEDERLKMAEERRRTEKRHLKVSIALATLTKRIRTTVVDQACAERVAQQPGAHPYNYIMMGNRSKDRCLALICMQFEREWYIVRRQRESFKKAIAAILNKHPRTATLVKEWHGLAHSVDVGTCVKLRLCNLKWLARRNILRIDEAAASEVVYSNDDIVNVVEEILTEKGAL